jgi:hypothetical protein
LLAKETKAIRELRRALARRVEPTLELEVLALQVRYPLVGGTSFHGAKRELFATFELAHARLGDLRATAKRDHLLA